MIDHTEFSSGRDVRLALVINIFKMFLNAIIPGLRQLGNLEVTKSTSHIN